MSANIATRTETYRIMVSRRQSDDSLAKQYWEENFPLFAFETLRIALMPEVPIPNGDIIGWIASQLLLGHPPIKDG